MHRDNRKMPTLEALQDALLKFCAYRERCKSEAKNKLRMIGATEDQANQVIERMEKEGFIDNQRFADLFARSKFSNNRWGRVKIRAELLRREIPDNTVRQALSSINEQDYLIALHDMMNKKHLLYAEKNPARAKEKAAAYAAQKGFETDVIRQVMHRL